MFRLGYAVALMALGVVVSFSHVMAQPALEATPILASEEMRTFPQDTGSRVEKTIVVERGGSHMMVEYTADSDIDIWVSFPITPPGMREEDGLTLNPIDTLKVNGIAAMSHGKIMIDLAESPAWSPRRKVFLVHVRGNSGSTVLVHDIEMKSATPGETISAVIHHLSLDEPVMLSSINTLWGYRMLGVNSSFVLGILFIILTSILLIRNAKCDMRIAKGFFVLSIVFLLLYDARFSFDLMRTSAKDIAEWRENGMYRQLGPIYAISDYLGDIRKNDSTMKVAICFDGTDFLQKQLRYALYPTPVRRAEDLWGEATHVVFVDTARNVYDNGIVSCGEALTREATLLKEFPERSSVYRFTATE